MGRGILALVVSAVLAAPASAAAAPSSASHEAWAESAIALVTREGIFSGPAAAFQPADPLTQGALSGALARLGAAASGAADPDTPVTIAGLDAQFVDALGLQAAAREFSAGASRAGLRPPARFGTEVVARLLGLRTSLPIADQAYELQPQQTATRADAAFSAARVLSLGGLTGSPQRPAAATPLVAADDGGAVQYVQGLAESFSLPQLGTWQQRVLQTAVSLIGYPYVWGGDDEKVEPGFDCSGLVWRVFKLQAYPGAARLASVFRGRTAAAMAGEVAKSERIGLAELEPADVLFFGDGPHSTPGEIDHAAIYLGDGWLIQSSDQGVSLAPLQWEEQAFAWARRPLAEAGLEPALTTG